MPGGVPMEPHRPPKELRDGAKVAEVIRDALQLGHQGAKPDRARRRLDFERRRGCPGEGIGIGDGTVARHTARELDGAIKAYAGYESLDPLVHIAEALFEADNRFAAGGELIRCPVPPIVGGTRRSTGNRSAVESSIAFVTPRFDCGLATRFAKGTLRTEHVIAPNPFSPTGRSGAPRAAHSG